jgi:uncharacterized protein
MVGTSTIVLTGGVDDCQASRADRDPYRGHAARRSRTAAGVRGHRLPRRHAQPVPKGTTAVWDDEHLVFADLRSPRTVANLRSNPAVEVNVVDPIARTGYRFKGAATVLTEGPLFEDILGFYEHGETPVRDARARIRHVVLIRVERALPLVSPAYDLGLSEEAIRTSWWDHLESLRSRRAGGRTSPRFAADPPSAAD